MKKLVVLLSVIGLLVAKTEAEWNPCGGHLELHFVDDTSSCDAYFTCVNGVAYPQLCPTGYHFNETLQLCEYASSKSCINCPSLGLEIREVAGSCTKFIICFAGVGEERECQHGLQFNAVLGQCDMAESVGCLDVNCPPTNTPGRLIFREHPFFCDKYFICHSGKPILQMCPHNTHYNKKTNLCDSMQNAECKLSQTSMRAISSRDFVCPASVVAQLPDPTSCESYFHCINGDLFEKSCGPGQVFDINRNRCGPRASSICILDPKEEPICPPSGVLQKPDPNSCESYFHCINGDLFKKSCGPGQVFDVNNKRCAPRATSVCILDEVEEVVIPTKLPGIPTTQFPPAINCPKLGVLQLPDPRDCESYYHCINGDLYEKSCGPGQVFDINSNRCATRATSICILDPVEEITIPTTQPPPPAFNCPSTGVLQRPDPKSCTNYFHCINGALYETTCGPGQVFDINSNRCASRATSICILDPVEEITIPTSRPTIPTTQPPPAIICPPTGVLQRPDPRACGNYYQCISGDLFEKSCIPGQVFDVYSNRCGPRATSTCITDPQQVTTTTTRPVPLPTNRPIIPTNRPQPTLPTQSTIPTAGTVSNTLPPPVSSTQHPSSPPGVHCSQSELSYYQHPDCTKFYRCVYGTLHVKSCPQNLHWNQRESICDYVYNARCPNSLW